MLTDYKKGPLQNSKRVQCDVVAGLNSLFDGDLADMQNVSKYNDGVKFLLILKDVFSRFLWVVPLKD